MQKLILTLILLISAQILIAAKLPDGTIVDDRLIKEAYTQYRQYTFNSPVLLNTPLGRKELKYVHFEDNGRIQAMRFSSMEKIKIPAGEVSAIEVEFYYYGSKPYISKVVLADNFTVKIPAGNLFLENKDSITFDCFDNMISITMAGKRKLIYNGSTIMISGNIITNAGYRDFGITLAEPAEIKTPAGKLKFAGIIKFNSDGSLLSGTLEKAQKADTPQGRLLITFINFAPGGKVYYCTLASPGTLETLWGSMKLKGGVRFATNGKVDSGTCDSIQAIRFSFGECRVKDNFYFDYSAMKSNFTLAEDQKVLAPFGEQVITRSFGSHPDGSLAWFTPKNDLTLQTPFGEFINKGGSTMGLYPDGKVEYFTIKKPRIIDTHAGKLKVTGLINLYNDGKLKSAETLNPFVIKSRAGNLTVKGYVAFYNNGNVQFCSLEKSTTLKTSAGNISVQGYADFNETGSLIEGRLAAPVKIKGVTYRKGSVIKFNESGEVISPMPGK